MLVALASAATIAACADALHLDPPGASSSSSGSASGSSSGGTGGHAGHDGGADAGPTSCTSNPDCAYPTAVCDTIAHECVECLVISDCVTKPGTVCSLGKCACPAPPGTELTYCADESPACIDTSTSPTNCGTCGTTCFGTCSAGQCSNAWTVVPSTLANSPSPRSRHVAVWTGTKMFVWGGDNAAGTPVNDGALYDPVAGTWTSISNTNAPDARHDATAVWDDVDNLVLVWGGAGAGGVIQTGGGRYNPATDTWTPIAPLPANNAPAGAIGHTAVWAKPISNLGTTTAAMIVWGGFSNAAETIPMGTGGIYDPAANSGAGAWVGTVPDFTAGPSPSIARGNHVAVWDSSSRMVVFGGSTDPGTLADGLTYSFIPPGNWNTIGGGTGGPTARIGATGDVDPTTNLSVLFGGSDLGGPDAGPVTYFGDAYELGTTGWGSLGGTAATVDPRIHHTAVVVQPTKASAELIVFGGVNATGLLATGWATGTGASGMWSALPTPGPSARAYHTAVSTGTTMILWGGVGPAGALGDGAIYNAAP